jgi:hypothetical protein
LVPGASDPILPFTPHDHDIRIDRDGFIFYVRGVKIGEPFRATISWDGSLAGFLLTPALKVLAAAARQPVSTWKVGVLRMKNRKLGGRIKIVHRERLPRGTSPTARIAELAERVDAGDFDF